MQHFTIKTTKKKQILDITDILDDMVQKKSWHHGVLYLFLKHTTAAVTTADLDPGTDLDMLDAFKEMVPKLKYRHMHDPSHVPDHILTSIIGNSLTLPIEDTRLSLGTWQRLVLVEFNGPKDRKFVTGFSEQKK